MFDLLLLWIENVFRLVIVIVIIASYIVMIYIGYCLNVFAKPMLLESCFLVPWLYTGLSISHSSSRYRKPSKLILWYKTILVNVLHILVIQHFSFNWRGGGGMLSVTSYHGMQLLYHCTIDAIASTKALISSNIT